MFVTPNKKTVVLLDEPMPVSPHYVPWPEEKTEE